MNDDTKSCPYCGKEIKKEAIKCRYCGKFLNEDNKEENKYFNNKVSKKKKYILLITLLMIFIGIIVAIIKSEPLYWTLETEFKSDDGIIQCQYDKKIESLSCKMEKNICDSAKIFLNRGWAEDPIVKIDLFDNNNYSVKGIELNNDDRYVEEISDNNHLLTISKTVYISKAEVKKIKYIKYNYRSVIDACNTPFVHY